MNILLFRVGGIGDVILTTPLVRQIKKNFPDSKIDYLVGKRSAPVLEDNTYLNEIIEVEENIFFELKFFRILKLIFKISKKGYDNIFVLGKHWAYHLISFLFRIPKRIGFKRKNDLFLNFSVDYNKRDHESRFYVKLLKGLNKRPDYNDLGLEVPLDKGSKKFADDFFKENNLNSNVIGICPGGGVGLKSRETLKRWPKDHWVKLIKLIKKSGKIPLLIGGKSDKGVKDYILERISVLSAISQTSILEAGALLGKCRAVVSNDSGLMHLSAAKNPKVISIFGPTSPKRFAPLLASSIYLFNSDLKCNPCYNLYGDFEKKCKNRPSCLYFISPRQVFEALESII